MEKRKKSLNPRHAMVNSISNVNPTPLSESPLRENAKTFQKYARPYSPPQNLSSEFETRMREYRSTHSEQLVKFEEAVYRQKGDDELIRRILKHKDSGKVVVEKGRRHPHYQVC